MVFLRLFLAEKNHGSSADQNVPGGYQEVVQNYQQSQVKFVLNERQGNKN